MVIRKHSRECCGILVNVVDVQNYFQDWWNVFDFITVIGSVTDVLVSEFDVRSATYLIYPFRKRSFNLTHGTEF